METSPARPPDAAASAGQPAAPAAQRVALTGASGLIGRHVAADLTMRGYRVHPLVRRAPQPGTTEIRWDPAGGEVDARALAGVQAVVHLAGENVAGGRWTAARKAAIRDSRVLGTALLSQCLANLSPRPAVFIAASAIGYYGDRGDELLTEDSPPGGGFLADVCRAWEAATEPAGRAGVRVINLRIGVVLSRAGGALAKMLTPFRLGLGGRVGSGRQYMSWIALSDLVRAIQHLIITESVSGPVNAVAPRAVTNAEFAARLGRVLGRPAFLPLPAILVRGLFGEMARALLLASTRVRPKRLEASGFTFAHPDLESALRAELEP